jgi:hypothetical protein
VVIAIKGGITLWLLESLSTASFVLVKGGAIITLTLTAAVVTVAWSYVVVRQHGLAQPPDSDGCQCRPNGYPQEKRRARATG